MSKIVLMFSFFDDLYRVWAICRRLYFLSSCWLGNREILLKEKEEGLKVWNCIELGA